MESDCDLSLLLWLTTRNIADLMKHLQFSATIVPDKEIFCATTIPLSGSTRFDEQFGKSGIVSVIKWKRHRIFLIEFILANSVEKLIDRYWSLISYQIQ